MPSLLLSMLLQLLWKLGAPLLQRWINDPENRIGKWLRKTFPNIDWDNIVPVLQKMDEDKKAGKSKLRACIGPSCPLSPVDPQ